MKSAPKTPERLLYLVDAACTDAISDAESHELEALLLGDAEARRFYASYCRMHAELLFLVGARRVTEVARQAVREPQKPTSTYSVLDAAPSGWGGFSLQSWPVAYLVAAVVIGVGLTVAAIVHVSGPEQIAAMSEISSSQSATAATQPASHAVGRVTGVTAGKVQGSRLKVQDAVVLGQRIAISSGLLEITYDTGAKVILQGPVTYEVDSPTGGYLAVGKLTARLEKVAGGQWPAAGKGERGEGRGGSGNKVASEDNLASPNRGRQVGGEGGLQQNNPVQPQSALTLAQREMESKANPQSLIPNPPPITSHSLSTRHTPLFTIATPTAIVTDLGTEFGVRVERDGRCDVHVLQGTVEAKYVKPKAGGDAPVRLTAGEAASFDSVQSTVRRSTAIPSDFVRTIVAVRDVPDDLIVADAFDYPDSRLSGNSGGVNGPCGRWSGAWFREGDVVGSQAEVSWTSIATRFFQVKPHSGPPKPIYFSARFTKNGPATKYAWLLRLTKSVNDDNRDDDDASIGIVDDQYRANLAFDRAIELFGTYQHGHQALIVGKLEFNVNGKRDRLQVWVDPTGYEKAAIVSRPIEADVRWTTPNYVHLRHVLADDGPYRIDDVRIGYTWDSVVRAEAAPKAERKGR